MLVELVRFEGRPVLRERLMETFWPHMEPAAARGNLKTALWSIRKALRKHSAQHDVIGDRLQVRFSGPVVLDIAEPFHESSGSSEFLPDDYSDWAELIRENVRAEYERFLNSELDRNPNVQNARALLAIDPASERAYTIVIAADVKAERHSAARALLARATAAVSEVDPPAAQRLDQRFASLKTRSGPETQSLPFVGRVPELGALCSLLDPGPPGNVVLLSGPAGMGKTALLEEFARVARASNKRVFAQRGRRYANGGFSIWQALFEEVSGSTLNEILAREGVRTQQLIVSAIASAVQRDSVLIIDDLHEVQGDSLALFFALADRVHQIGGVIVAALRPETLAETVGGLAHVGARLVTLEPLDREASAAALTALGDCSEATVEAFYARTQGFPMLMQAFAQHAASPRELAHIIADPKLPKDVRGLLVARVAAQTKSARSVALALALEGSLSLDELEFVTRTDRDVLLDSIDELMTIGVLRDAAGGLRPEFTHDLFAEVASSAASAMRRSRMHVLIAESIETRLPARAAGHWLESGECERAGLSFAAAGKASLEQFNFRDALQHFNAALVAAPEIEIDRRIDWICNAASCESRIGLAHESSERAKRALIEARTFKAGPHALAKALHAVTRFGDGSYDDDVRNGEEAATLASRVRDFELAAYGLKSAARGHSFSGRYAQAVAAGLGAVGHARNGDDEHVLFYCLLELLDIHLNYTHLTEAFKLETDTFDLARRMGPRYEAELLFRRADGLSHADRFEESIALSERAREVALSAPPTYEAFAFDSRLVAWQATWHKAEVQAAAADFDASLSTAEWLAANEVIADDPLRATWARISRMRALSGRARPGDREEARRIADDLAPTGLRPQSRAFVDVERAVLAARERDMGSTELLNRALDSVRRMMRIAPRGWDRRYRDLAVAAKHLGLRRLAREIELEGHAFGQERRQRAGAYWIDRPAVLEVVSSL